ncbi:ABC transporter substrate-binding protein [Phytohabitans suffuscus]|uniref:SsuA/THI5-like domain-containing protein n=1 Tax=Phytohabitans suffuscus TaxID=624315 RepID=A0A6F8YEN2_9ACTN|nr:ABC transporter substrate-binding protein [Phytohabitans suffuscus]BCB84527.1 hypothetical protein Psuf_018400 [Phytohabitans suffuscus]
MKFDVISPRKRTAALLASGLVLVAAAACGNETPATEDGGLYKMKITVSTYPTNVPAVPFIVAIKKGYFAEHGIEVTDVAGSSGGGTTVRNVLTGDLPFGGVAPAAAVQAYLAGAPIKIVGGLQQGVAEVAVATKNPAITNIEDLRGKKVGYSNPGSATQGILGLTFEAAGMVPGKDVEMVATGGLTEAATALNAGAVDAAVSLLPAHASHPDFKVVWWSDQYVKAFQQTVVITSPEMIKTKPDIVRGFLAALDQAVQFIRSSPEETAKLWAAEGKMPEAVALETLKRTNAIQEHSIGLQADHMQAVDKVMHSIELVGPQVKIPWKEIIDQQFIPEGASRITGPFLEAS